MTPGEADFLARVELDHLKWREQEASGWLVVVTDLERDPPAVVSAYGPFESAEIALVKAGEMDADPDCGAHPVDGEVGWRHDVVPLFAYTEPEPKRD